jgi:hypothetical protein
VPDNRAIKGGTHCPLPCPIGCPRHRFCVAVSDSTVSRLLSDIRVMDDLSPIVALSVSDSELRWHSVMAERVLASTYRAEDHGLYVLDETSFVPRRFRLLRDHADVGAFGPLAEFLRFGDRSFWPAASTDAAVSTASTHHSRQNQIRSTSSRMAPENGGTSRQTPPVHNLPPGVRPANSRMVLPGRNM